MEKEHKLTKAQKNLLVTAHKKRLCEQRALRLVEMALEPAVQPDWLTKQVALLSPQHYDDITEERAVIGLCGYPLCDRPLQHIPNKQFQISTLTNRVYDIVERKKFCSSMCFRASRHLHSQVPTSPLWLRDKEPPAKITLLDAQLNCRGLAGDLVDLGVARAPPDDPVQVTTDDVIRGIVSDYDLLAERVSELRLPPEKVSAGEERAPRRARQRPPPSSHNAEKRHPPDVMGTRKEPRSEFHAASDQCEQQSGACRSSGSDSGSSATEEAVPCIHDAAMVGVDSVAEKERETDGQAPTVAEAPGEQVSCSPDEMRGPPSLAALVVQSADRADLVRRLEATSPTDRRGPPSSAFKRPSARRRRAESPRRVVAARLRDWLRSVDAEAGPDGTGRLEAVLEPTPGALALDRTEAESRNLQLQAYLRGQVAPPAPKREETANAQSKMPAQLPLVHSREQDRMRRKIVNDYLGKAVTRLLPLLGLSWTEVAPPLRLLTAGFHLTAENVTLTPVQWQLTALLVLRHLLRQCRRLTELAREPEVFFSTELGRWKLTDEQLQPLYQLMCSASGPGGLLHQNTDQARGASPSPPAGDHDQQSCCSVSDLPRHSAQEGASAV